MQMVTIAYLDTCPVAQAGLAIALQICMDDVKVVTGENVSSLAARLAGARPDLVVVTVNQPKTNTLLLLGRCRKEFTDVPLVIYDHGHDPAHMARWLESGIAGYIFKTDPLEVLLECAQAALNGGRYYSPTVWQGLLGGITPNYPKKRAKEQWLTRYLGLPKPVRKNPPPPKANPVRTGRAPRNPASPPWEAPAGPQITYKHMKIVFCNPYPAAFAGFEHLIKSHRPHLSCHYVDHISALPGAGLQGPVELLVIAVNARRYEDVRQQVGLFHILCPQAAVALIDEEDQWYNLEKLLRGGVSGYVQKSETPGLLLDCIDKVLAGEKYLSPVGFERYVELAGKPQGETARQLPVREYEVALYLSLGKTNNWISAKMQLKPNTVATVKKRVFTKMGVENAIELKQLMPQVKIKSSAPFSPRSKPQQYAAEKLN